MKISKRKFALLHNIEVQWVTSLCDYGVLPFERKGGRILIEESSIHGLEEGTHYVVCPHCGKKMSSINKKHAKACSWAGFEKAKYCDLCLRHKKKSSTQKIRQSNTLKKRFRTRVGEETRKQITEASRRINSDPEFLKKKSGKSIEVQNRPEMRKLRSKKSKEMWRDPAFLKQHREYVDENIESLRASAARARKCLRKTSKLHLGYKQKMEDAGLRGFVSEFLYGYYSIDEADPFAKVAIEIDGCYWHGCESCGFVGDKRIVAIQKRKDTYLRNRGWLVLHIKEHEIKRDPFFRIEQIRELQEQRRKLHAEKIRSAMLKGTLCVKGLRSEFDNIEWFPVADILRHRTPHKKMYQVTTELGSVVTTEDHSLFLFEGNREVRAKDLHSGDLIVGSFDGHERTPVVVQKVEETIQEEYTYDLSVPGPQNFMLHTGILAHNSYSISGVSLDIEKSSKYESMKNNFIQEYDKAKEEAKRSIKILKGLKQPRYGIGISSALGPYSRPGVQSRRNYISGFRGGWA